MSSQTPTNSEPQSLGTEGPLVIRAGDEEVVIPAVIVTGQKAFARDLVSLLPTHSGQWVAYRGNERLGFDKDPDVLLRRCLDQGMPEEEIVVRCVEEGADSIVFGTLVFPDHFSPALELLRAPVH
jgi:hypothetical protein